MRLLIFAIKNPLKMRYLKFSAVLFLFSLFSVGKSQNNSPNGSFAGAPVLSINTNPQALASGWVGVVASELNTQNGLDQNPALLASEQRVIGFQFLNYAPWLRKVVKGSNLFESGVYASLGKHSFGFSARYMSLPSATLTDIIGGNIGTIEPYEYFLNAKYAIRLSESFSLGAGFKYIRSDLTGGIPIQGFASKPANVFAGDFGLSYRKTLKQTEHFRLRWNAGLSILNIGSRFRYAETADGLFLPQTLKLGSLITLKWNMDNTNYFALDFSYQADKFLVPTPPVYDFGPNGSFIITDGLDPDVSPIRGAIQSFYDAPGGLNEELREIIHQFGTEARLSLAENNLLIVFRAGYFNEHATKGNRKFITAGTGLGIFGIRADFARIIPTVNSASYPATYFVSLGGRFSLNEGSLFKFIE